MHETDSAPRIALRIPGAWAHPGELRERLPDGFRLTPEALILPDETQIDFIPMPPDEIFPGIFQSSCRRRPRDEELAVVARYTVNVGLNGPGGSFEHATAIMQGAAALVRAGGAGVFIDNSALAHGGGDWIDMTDDAGPDAISFAFVSIVRSPQNVYTMGMQVMGFPDLLMRSADVDDDGETIIEIVRYVCSSGRPMDLGHVIADEVRLRFQVVARTGDDFPPDSPMHNPFGRLKIASLKDVADGN